MKRSLRKAAAFALAGALFLSLLSGCKPPEVSGGVGKQQSEAGKEAETEEPVVITAVIKDMSADDPVSLEYLENVSRLVSNGLGKEVKIELAPISEGTYSESMGLLLQSGVIPDLIYFQGGDYQFAITQGILEDLTPYIENSTYVKATMQSFNEERIKNYPYLIWLSSDRIRVPLVRQDWFNEMESGTALLEDPTPENYRVFFKEIKEKKNLQSAYTIPGDLSELDTVFNLAFGIEQTWMEQEGSYVYYKVSNAQREKLEYYASLYKDGLLDNEWISRKWDTKESAFYDGQAGVVAGTAGSIVNVYNTKMVNQNGEGAALKVLPPAKGKAQGYTPSDISKESRGWAISAYSEHKEEVFAVLEFMAGQEGQILDKLGYEGVHYTQENGIYTLTDKKEEWYARIHESIVTLDVKFSEETPYFSKSAEDSLEEVSRYLTLDNNFILPEEYVTFWDAGEALYAEYASDVISGKKSIDTFDVFVAEWNALGGKQITDYANELMK